MVEENKHALTRTLDQAYDGIFVNTLALIKLFEINYGDKPEKLKELKKGLKDKIFENINEIFNY